MKYLGQIPVPDWTTQWIEDAPMAPPETVPPYDPERPETGGGVWTPRLPAATVSRTAAGMAALFAGLAGIWLIAQTMRPRRRR